MLSIGIYQAIRFFGKVEWAVIWYYLEQGTLFQNILKKKHSFLEQRLEQSICKLNS